MNIGLRIIVPFLVCVLLACGSPANNRAIDIKDLEKVQEEESKKDPPPPSRDALTAEELISVSDCQDLQCVQLFMKEFSNDFLHAKKGEFAALHRSTVVDTAGKRLVMPLSTLYLDVNPQASWRLAHTVHRIEIGNKLLADFHRLGFALVDSGYFRGSRNKQARFRSAEYPGTTLYVSATYEPWYMKGLYKNVSWPCWVFEVYRKR